MTEKTSRLTAVTDVLENEGFRVRVKKTTTITRFIYLYFEYLRVGRLDYHPAAPWILFCFEKEYIKTLQDLAELLNLKFAEEVKVIGAFSVNK